MIVWATFNALIILFLQSSAAENINKELLCNYNYFRCSDGSSCIPQSQVCDNIINCNDESDENLNCDNNKCATDNLCSQICTNLPDGSYKCSCVAAYETIGYNCKAKGPEPILIVSTDSTIQSIRLRSHIKTTILGNLTNVVGIASDFHLSRVFFSDESDKVKAIRSVHFNGTDVKTAIKAGLQVPEDIAIDWVSRNLYFTDSRAQHIAVCSMTRDNYCHVIIKEEIISPRAIELDITNGYIFWTDWGNQPHISRSLLDGSKMKILVSNTIQKPNGLAIDHIAERLYWCDESLNRIESIRFNGQSRKIIVDDSIYHPSNIAVFENSVYWSDLKRYTVETCNKKTGKNRTTLVKDVRKKPMEIHIFHLLLQMPNYNPCHHLNCSHQCILRTQNTAVCVCPAGFYLSKNNLTCEENKTETLILLAYGGKIAKFYPKAIGHNILHELKPKTELTNITAIASDGRNHLIYIADSNKKIILSLDLTNMATNILVSTHISFIRDMAFDKLGNNLYWIDTVHKTVEILSLRTNKRMILVKLDHYPSAITLSTKYGLLFVAQSGTDSFIEKMNMDGTQRLVLIRKPDSSVTSLVADSYSKRLFWSDSVSGKINYITFNGKYHFTVRENMGHLASLIRYRNRLYWIDEKLSNIFWTDSITDLVNFAIPIFYQHYNNSTTIAKLAVLSFEKETSEDNDRKINKCASNPCSHLCLLTPTNYRCACATDFILQTDGSCKELKKYFENSIQRYKIK